MKALDVYVAGKDVKAAVLIVDGLNEEFIIGMMLIGAHQLNWNPDSTEFVHPYGTKVTAK